MGRSLFIAIAVVVLLLPMMAFADTGKVLKVVDGDTFMMEVAGVRGPEAIEANLRCSDAPLLTSPFGQQSRTYLETLLKESTPVSYKLQAYCGSQKCFEILAFFPDPLNPDKITYLNTRMIAAGMARNNACRGVFKQAEDQAKAARRGIWSTSQRLAFTEVAKTAEPEVKKSTKSQVVLDQKQTSAPAIVDVNRADRTVTLKSKAISLSKAVAAIDTVSTLPVSLYLVEDQKVPLSLDRVPWYVALQQVVRVGNLKQVNMNGKIDLYDQLFYYKHIAPYLKLSSNEGVYINVASGDKEEPAVDDGVTRYVFINEYENSAEVARAQRESQHGYVQVHKDVKTDPALDHGRFEISGQEQPPVEAVAPEVVAPKPQKPLPPPLKPYTGKPVAVAEQPVPEVAPPAEKNGAEEVVAGSDAATMSQEQAEVPVEGSAGEDSVAQPSAEKEGAGLEEAEAGAAGHAEDASPFKDLEIERSEIIALVVVCFVVIFGGIFLSRSAAKTAAKAEESVDPSTLMKPEDESVAAPEPEVDEEYEKAIFDDLDHAEDDTVKVVDEVFDGTPVKSETDVPEESAPQEEVLTAAEGPENVDASVEAKIVDAADEPQAPAPVAPPVEKQQAQKPSKKAKAVKKARKSPTIDSGNYAVTVEDYERMMKPPKREPRKDCLFEVSCTLDGQTSTGIGLDISSGGLFIDSKEPYAVGKVLEMEFKLSEGDPVPIRCRCAVTWVNERPDPIKPNYPNGYGVCFLDLDEATRKALGAFLDMNTETEGGAS